MADTMEEYLVPVDGQAGEHNHGGAVVHIPGAPDAFHPTLDLPAVATATAATSGGFSTKKKKVVLLAAVGLLAVVAIALGVVAGTVGLSNSGSGSAGPSSGTPAFSATAASFAVVSNNGATFQARPAFAADIGSLVQAPAPTVYHQDEHTTSARLVYRHTTTSAASAAHGSNRTSHTYLEYDVVKNNKAHCPSRHESVRAIFCTHPHVLGIRFSNRSMAEAYATQWSNGTVFFLRREWRCGKEHVRMFTSHPVLSHHGPMLYVDTTNVTIGHAFKSAKVRFFTNHSEGGPDAFHQLAHMPHAPLASSSSSSSSSAGRAPQGRDRREWMSSLTSGLESIVSGVATGVSQLANAVVNGELNVDQPYNSNYQLPSYSMSMDNSGTNNDGSSYSVTGDASFTSTLAFNTDVALDVESYTVQSFSAGVTASVTSTLAADIQLTGSYTAQQDQQLSQATLASGTVVVFDIPVNLNLILTTYGGYSVNADVSATMSGSVTATGTASGGIQYTSSNGWQPSASSSYSLNSNLGSPQFGANAEVIVYLSAGLYLQADYLGGPEASATVYGVIDSAMSSDGSGCVAVSASAGCEVDVAAQIGIDIPEITDLDYSTPWATVYGPTDFWSDSISSC